MEGAEETHAPSAGDQEDDSALAHALGFVDPPRAESPMWWPQVAAAQDNPRTFGRATLPKASKLPKPGTVLQRDVGNLFEFGTLTSLSSPVRALSHRFSACNNSWNRPDSPANVASRLRACCLLPLVSAACSSVPRRIQRLY